MDLFERVEKWLEEGKEVIVRPVFDPEAKVTAVEKVVWRYLKVKDERGDEYDISYLNEKFYQPRVDGNRVIVEYVNPHERVKDAV